MPGLPHSNPTRLMGALGFFGWFPSAFLHRLGSLFVGSPDALQLPGNFWVSQPDRLIKEPTVDGASVDDVRVSRLRVNHFRVLLTPRVALLAFCLSFSLCVAVQAVLAGAAGLSAGWRHMTQSPESKAIAPALDQKAARSCAMLRRQGSRATGMDPVAFDQAVISRCGATPSDAEAEAAHDLNLGDRQ